MPGPEMGVPYCKPLKPLATSLLVLSLNAAPSQGYRTQGKALIEKGRKAEKQAGGRKKDQGRGDLTHTEKSRKALVSARKLFLSIFDQVKNTNTRE